MTGVLKVDDEALARARALLVGIGSGLARSGRADRTAPSGSCMGSGVVEAAFDEVWNALGWALDAISQCAYDGAAATATTADSFTAADRGLMKAAQ